jgi:signal transduction histidine kinase
MVKRLREGIEKMERFNNDVSHELRTPLTVISTQIELALKKDREKEYYKNSLEKIDDESKKMKHMVQDMLILTKYTKDNIEETFCLCDLNSILMNCIEKFVFFADKKNISIEVKKFEKTLLKANSSLITILFSNLLDNAIKYSLENKKIFLSLFEENGRIIFIIKDEGIGIPKELLPKITDKFYRVDESRNKSIKGFGLGLSIVKNIIELHNGNMNIGSKESVGTTVLITFEANLEHINVRNS